jgi:hypothetical protein
MIVKCGICFEELESKAAVVSHMKEKHLEFMEKFSKTMTPIEKIIDEFVEIKLVIPEKPVEKEIEEMNYNELISLRATLLKRRNILSVEQAIIDGKVKTINDRTYKIMRTLQ